MAVLESAQAACGVDILVGQLIEIVRMMRMYVDLAILAERSSFGRLEGAYRQPTLQRM